MKLFKIAATTALLLSMTATATAADKVSLDAHVDLVSSLMVEYPTQQQKVDIKLRKVKAHMVETGETIDQAKTTFSLETDEVTSLKQAEEQLQIEATIVCIGGGDAGGVERPKCG